MIENWIGFESDFTRNLIRVLICFVRSLESFRVRSERERAMYLCLLYYLVVVVRERECVCLMRVLYVHFCLRRLSNKERLFMKTLA